MKKTIIAIALVIVIVAVIFTACKSKTDGEDTTANVPGETTTIEVFTDKDTGETYIINKDGERIPVTTGLDGSMEFSEDLYTKTVEQVSKEAESMSQARETQTAAGTTSPNTTQSQGQPTTDSNGMEIGGGDPLDEDHAAVINWG